MAEQQPMGIPAAPNEGIVRGKVVEIEAGPDGVGSIWKVHVDETHDVGQLRNLARAHTGGTIVIYVHPDMKREFKAGDTVAVNVSFQGDERGGAFFLTGDKVRKL